MPLVEVSLAAGRSPQAIRSLVTAVHGAVVEAVGAAPDDVTVLVREVPRSHWARGGTTTAEADAPAGALRGVATAPTPTPQEGP